MGWKDWPYWLKGGIIGLIVFLVISLFFILYEFIGIGVFIDFFFILSIFFSIITSLPFYIYDFILQILSINIYWNSFSLFISGVINYFFTGAIIGWIYGKIKERKNKLPIQTKSLRT